MKPTFSFILGLVGVLLTGCVTSTVPGSTIGSGAFIRGVNRVTTRTDFDAFYLEAIDGASVRTPSFRSTFENPVPIGPGERLIVGADHGGRTMGSGRLMPNRLLAYGKIAPRR